MDFTTFQQTIIDAPNQSKVFVSGPTGSGKTTAAIQRLLQLRSSIQTFPGSLLILTPQRTMAHVYGEVTRLDNQNETARIELLTMSSLVRRLVRLFWPLIADKTAFKQPFAAPAFLTAESAQYYMGKLVGPMMDRGGFGSIRLTPNRLYSQLIDNLNKSAIISFPYTEIGERLTSAWSGAESQLRVYTDAQTAINTFRDYCFEHNLLDFSLQVELFRKFLWPNPILRRYIRSSYPYLIYDNPEEDPPYVHDTIKELLPDLQGALILNDTNGGFQQFLGADPISATSLAKVCESVIETQDVINPSTSRQLILRGLARDGSAAVRGELRSDDLAATFVLPTDQYRFLPQLLDGVCEWVNDRIQTGVPPSEIAILSPYLSSALKLALGRRLENYSIPSTILASSTPLIHEPYTKALIDLLSLTQKPDELDVNRYDQSLAWMQMVKGLDLIRAKLIWDKVSLQAADYLKLIIDDELRTRIPDHLLEKSITLLDWLTGADVSTSFAITLTRLFDEVLSKPGYSSETDQTNARLVSQLIESYNKFIAALPPVKPEETHKYNTEFINALRSGIISAQYVEDIRQSADEDRVLIAPAMTFLTRNRVVDYQVWLSIGSDGWYRRLEQPLTNPHVLSRNWPKGKKWDAYEELKASEVLIGKVTSGLIARCRKQIFLGYSQYGETGTEEQGLLLRRLQYLYRLARLGTQHA
ncbi:MAG: DEAD/DEAH box helicase [Anaerolineaceae bacterium]